MPKASPPVIERGHTGMSRTAARMQAAPNARKPMVPSPWIQALKACTHCSYGRRKAATAAATNSPPSKTQVSRLESLVPGKGDGSVITASRAEEQLQDELEPGSHRSNR